jgi:hypothetical protein
VFIIIIIIIIIIFMFIKFSIVVVFSSPQEFSRVCLQSTTKNKTYLQEKSYIIFNYFAEFISLLSPQSTIVYLSLLICSSRPVRARHLFDITIPDLVGKCGDNSSGLWQPVSSGHFSQHCSLPHAH